MATLSSHRFYELIDRIFNSRRHVQSAVFDIVKANYSGTQLLAALERSIPAKPDEAWLSRPELRGVDATINYLESEQFAKQIGSVHALWLDDRCGLIGQHKLGDTGSFAEAGTTLEVLRLASSYQASGLVLASNDVEGKLASDLVNSITSNIARKGEAIDLFLLDHLILSSSGWRRTFPIREGR